MQYHHHRAGSPQCDPDLRVTLESTPLQYDNYVICCQPVNGAKPRMLLFAWQSFHAHVWVHVVYRALEASVIITFVEVGGTKERKGNVLLTEVCGHYNPPWTQPSSFNSHAPYIYRLFCFLHCNCSSVVTVITVYVYTPYTDEKNFDFEQYVCNVAWSL